MEPKILGYILGAMPTAILVIAHFLRTEKRLTRIEVMIQVLLDNRNTKTIKGEHAN